MAIPTTEEFDAWLLLAATRVQINTPLPAKVTIDAAADYLRTADDERLQAWDTLHQMPAARWLSGQREYRRAFERVFQRTRRKSEVISDAEWFRAKAIRIFESEERIRAKYPKPESRWDDDLRGRLERSASNAFHSGWTYRTMDAVAEYLGRRTATSFLDAVREIEGAARNARAAIARYSRLAEDVNRAQFLGVEVRPVNLSSRHFPTFEVPPITSPIGRKDSRSDERLFVYRMFLANRRATRSPRIEAIAELMGLEGFRHQYDTRTIERLCAKFAEWERAKGARRVNADVSPAKDDEKSSASGRGGIALVRTA